MQSVTAKLLNQLRAFNDQLYDAHLKPSAAAAGKSVPATARPAVKPAAVAEDSPALDELWKRAKEIHPTMPERKGKS